MKRKELIAAFRETLGVLHRHGADGKADNVVFFTYALSSSMAGHVAEGKENRLIKSVFKEIKRTMSNVRKEAAAKRTERRKSP